IGADAAEHVGDLLVALDRLAQGLAGAGLRREHAELALVEFLEGDALAVHPGQVLLERRALDARIEIVEIPVRQVTEPDGAPGLWPAAGHSLAGGSGLGGNGALAGATDGALGGF